MVDLSVTTSYLSDLDRSNRLFEQTNCALALLRDAAYKYGDHDIETLAIFGFPVLHMARETLSEAIRSLTRYKRGRVAVNEEPHERELELFGIAVSGEYAINAALSLEHEEISGGLAGAIHRAWEIVSDLGEHYLDSELLASEAESVRPETIL